MTIASILILFALGAQAQPLGSVADSQFLVRRTHPKNSPATSTIIPVPVFVDGNGFSSDFGPAPGSPDYPGSQSSFQTSFQPVGQPSFQPVAVVPDFGTPGFDFVVSDDPCGGISGGGARSGKSRRRKHC
ncbi:hypothetical protein DSO57_1005445 [Entomophthora muscae]|uniref:Uncharacterized protein n=1 Tax=Entomophthora muscae TaxID=34485 RepID=A0ACC2SKQ9_9FUNG|nr:hypothetical protein DSO57_1005445 [Entomophthora muscae]